VKPFITRRGLALVGAHCVYSMNQNGQFEIRVYPPDPSGNTSPPPQAELESIRKLVEQFVGGASGAFRLIVSDQTIAELRKREKAIEVIYRSPALLRFGDWFGKVNRVFIPLSGKLPDGVVFYAGSLRRTLEEARTAPSGTSYGPGALQSSAGTSRLKDGLREAGVSL
jgi:hypothetical protein